MNNICCFFGHRKVDDTLELRKKLYDIIEKLIVDDNIEFFLFGSRSKFNSLCYDIVSMIKEKHPHIKRIYVRAEYPYISDSYKSFLLGMYEDTYYPESILSSAKAVYIRRNYHMIDKSSVCVVYLNPGYTPPRSKTKHLNPNGPGEKSGTKIAYRYAEKKGKIIINVFN